MARARTIWTVLGVVAGVGAVAAIGYGVARAVLPEPPRSPRYPQPPGPQIPLRPPARDLVLGPMSARLSELIDSLDDDELQGVRNSMPAHWWTYVTVASQMPDDAGVRFALSPLSIDMSLWTDDQRTMLQSDLVGAMGIMKALALREILQDAGVL